MPIKIGAFIYNLFNDPITTPSLFSLLLCYVSLTRFHKKASPSCRHVNLAIIL